MKLVELCMANGQQLTEYIVVAQFISKISGDIGASDGDECISYFINGELNMCIRAAPAV